jgi:hypothetical protein
MRAGSPRSDVIVAIEAFLHCELRARLEHDLLLLLRLKSQGSEDETSVVER